MHVYSFSGQRIRTVLGLALISAGGSAALTSWITDHLSVNVAVTIARWVSPFALFGAVFFVYDRWGWKTSLGKLLGQAPPDMAGKWQVTIEPNDFAAIKGYCRIQQTWTKASIVMEFPTPSRSQSTAASIEMTGGEAAKISFIYQNEPSQKAGHLKSHWGTVDLRPADGSLVGEYYTSGHRKSYGSIRLTPANA